MGMVGDACLSSNAYYPRTPGYTLYTGVHVCWSEHSDSFVYGFMILDYGLGTMTATAYLFCKIICLIIWLTSILVTKLWLPSFPSRGIGIISLKTSFFSDFNRRHYELISKYDSELKILLLQGLSESELSGDMVYKFRKVAGKPNFSDRFSKIVSRIVVWYTRKGYKIDVIKQSACQRLIQSWLTTLLTSLLACWCVEVQTLWRPQFKNYSFNGLGRNFLCLFSGSPGFNWWFSLASVFQCVVWQLRDIQASQHVVSVESLYLLH